VRRDEFVVALITAATVVAIGVEQAVVPAIGISLLDHIRRSYAPKNSVLEPANADHLRPVPPAPDARTLDGLVVYHFSANPIGPFVRITTRFITTKGNEEDR
jgi:MFS superfamily sulfate permease-like transporter